VIAECTITGRRKSLGAASVVTVTAREPNEELALELQGLSKAVEAAGIVSVASIGDCWVPSTIAAAVYAGHRQGREFDAPLDDALMRRELTALGDPQEAGR
jgi:dimethylamine/trimethylamine dehydrogenase